MYYFFFIKNVRLSTSQKKYGIPTLGFQLKYVYKQILIKLNTYERWHHEDASFSWSEESPLRSLKVTFMSERSFTFFMKCPMVSKAMEGHKRLLLCLKTFWLYSNIWLTFFWQFLSFFLNLFYFIIMHFFKMQKKS